jgi:hypothetical protein
MAESAIAKILSRFIWSPSISDTQCVTVADPGHKMDLF